MNNGDGNQQKKIADALSLPLQTGITLGNNDVGLNYKNLEVNKKKSLSLSKRLGANSLSLS
jgi:hypothetical protein